MSRYRSSFETHIGRGLSDLFLFANTSFLFYLNVVIAASISLLVVLWANWFFAGVVALMVVFVPYFGVAYLRKRRVDMFIRQLPEGLGSLSASLRSGLNLVKSLEHLVNHSRGPLAQEFSLVLAEYRMGRDLFDSLSALQKRMQRNELELLNSAISISRSVGGSLGDTLDSVARLLRQKAQVEAKIDAMTAMGRAQGWLAALFPFFIGGIFYAQEPEAMRCLFIEPVGWLALTVMSALIVMAIWMIRKIVRIDV
jgi:tight adherence protein B